MIDTRQQRISKMRRGAATVALTFVVVLWLGMVPTLSAQAQTFTVLHNFKGPKSDGNLPYAGLIQDDAGNFYGTTELGGAGSWGTVFKINPSGTETVLYSFCIIHHSCPTGGAEPFGGLARDQAGNLYGTTLTGGAHSPNGTVFKLNKSGKETVLYNFCSRKGCADGSRPFGGLIRDTAGNL